MSYVYTIRSRTLNIACEAPSQRYGPCTSPKAAVPVLRAIFAELDDYQENFILVVLNQKGRVIGHKVLSSGTETACLVSPEMVFRAALILGGTSILVSHNHPSGDPTPSREDIFLTKRLRSAGDLLGLPLADHIILGSPEFYSFRASEGWDLN